MNPPAHPPSAHPAHSRCPWCGAVVASSELSCPGCGAPVQRSLHATQSGWTELPPIKDMARVRAGNSTCQIEGLYVPVADFNLHASDGVYFAHHVLLWKDPQVQIRRMPLKGAFKRMLAGLPLVMTEATGPGHVAFSRDEPGEMIALPLQPGQSIDVREHMLLAATREVKYDWFSTDVWFQTGTGKETETQYPLGMFMDRFTAGATPGLLLLHAAGNVFVRDLQIDQTLLIKPRSLIYKDPSVRMGLKVDSLMASWSRTTRVIWLHLRGPGRVAVQSAYEPVEDAGKTITQITPSPGFYKSLGQVMRMTRPFMQETPDPAPTPTDPRHVLMTRMAMDALADGVISPEEQARLIEAAKQNGMCEYDVRLIIKQVQAHGR